MAVPDSSLRNPATGPGTTPRRALLAASAAGLAALAGCGSGGSDTESPSPTTGATATTTAPPELVSSWALPAYRSTPNGSLVMAVSVRNPTDSHQNGTLRVFFELNGTEYEQTAEVELDADQSKVYTLTFGEVNRSAVEDISIYKELT